MPPLNIILENNEILINFLATCVMPITITLLAILVSSFICITSSKDEDKDEDDDENENEEEEDDDDDGSTPEENAIDDDTSDDDENNYVNENQQYTSVMYKSFSLLNKKQLIKLTGQKHKYKNKDELIVIAMYKFMIKSIEKSDSLPKGIKVFILANKKIMKNELLELYKIPSDETSVDEKEIQ
jgi:hypothetical protein